MVHHSWLTGVPFFSGAPEYQPPSKVRIVSSTKTRAQIQTEKQHSDEEVTFESPQAQTQHYETLSSTSIAQQFKPGSGDNDPLSPIKQNLYPQYDVCNVDINNPCITLRPKYHYAPLRTHVIVAGDVTLKLNLKLTLTGDIHMVYMSV